MSIIPIGELSHRFALEAPLRISDDGGGAIITWSLVAELWGALRPRSGKESVEADGLTERRAHEIWIRHRPGVTAEMRFVLGARVFDIEAVMDVGERRRFLRCLVEEKVP